MRNSTNRQYFQPKSIYNFVDFLQSRGMKIRVFREHAGRQWILEKEGISMRFKSTYDIGYFLEPIYEFESEKAINEYWKKKMRRELLGMDESEKKYVETHVNDTIIISN